MPFDDESDFEKALISALQKKGWEDKVLSYPTEEDLIENWAQILFENNRDIDRLNDVPLNGEEMQELLDQVRTLRTPLALNGFINGKTVAITRKNPADVLHYGKEVSLKIYDRMEIAAGQSRYQIAEQPRFLRHDKVLQDRRGDFMLLINGMPVFHVELKKSGVPVSEAYRQIAEYAHEQVFTGLFSLVQVFVAMNPEETVYFANPGPEGQFNPDFYFHWEDFNNEPVNDWRDIASSLLSIPMAHQLIGFYTIADQSDGILKVMRSYQYYAANKISDAVAKHKKDWEDGSQLGGYIWHTTGSGKTMTSFKAAQLIAQTKDADKVVFLMDRIELGTQSLERYQNFADDVDDVQGTENTAALIEKLRSTDPKDTLIVTSIQKMSNIKEDTDVNMRDRDLKRIQSKRIVFIIDECHRSTFGDMMGTIKQTFPHALFFGFTGTPVFEENERVGTTTADIFGSELHRYDIADGIRDRNVLGFDPAMVTVYQDRDIREVVALSQAKADSVSEALGDEKKSKVFNRFISPAFPMAGYKNEDGKYVKGIEDYVPASQYETDDYQQAVVDDITGHWLTMSRNKKFHALFATSSIAEAIRYYRKFRAAMPSLKVTCLFDPNTDNKGSLSSRDKVDGLKDILTDYNQLYGMDFSIGQYGQFKKDVSARLSHKEPYIRIQPEETLDLLIVVDQMLTGFDSKWLNTLYLDKVLRYENVIQAFSRTNRLFNINEKPFGSIRYYRYPHTMKRNIEDALKLYSGDRPFQLFADHLPENIHHMNDTYKYMVNIFQSAGIPDMDHLPEDISAKAKFAKLFREFSTYYQAAQIQGFDWKKTIYEYMDDGKPQSIVVVPTKGYYEILHQRYKELRSSVEGPGGDGGEDVPFDIDPYLSDQSTGVIDYAYMNSRFDKWMKQLEQPVVSQDELDKTMDELHKSFASFSQEDQRYANQFLHDVQSGDVQLEKGKTLQDYITAYAKKEKDEQIHAMHEYFHVDEDKLEAMMNTRVSRETINEYGRFDDLMQTVDKKAAQAYFEQLEGKKIRPFQVNDKIDKVFTDFILSGGRSMPHPGNYKLPN